MNVGCRLGAWRYSAKDYVQDGLVAMWDGIENTGWGKHEAYNGLWKDVVNGYELTGEPDTAVFDKKSVKFSGKTSDLYNSNIFSDVPSTFTIEISLKQTSVKNNYSVPLVTAIKSDNVDRIQINTEDTFRVHAVVYGGVIGTVYIGGAASGTVTIVYNGSLILVYHNGSHVGSMSNYRGSMLSCLRIANYFVSTGGKITSYTGSVYSVRYYKNKALTAAEIAANYAIDKARFGLT